MGEAKRRGNFEHRKQQSIEQAKLKAKAEAEAEYRRQQAMTPVEKAKAKEAREAVSMMTALALGALM